MASQDTPPVLFVIAGPNGAGKSTLYDFVLKQKINAPFINADTIQKTELNDQSMQGAYAAAEIAAERRLDMIRQKRSFVTETVFSHVSKNQLIDEAVQAGYIITLFHVGLEGANMAVERVGKRVQSGGHDVPKEKIRARYQRNRKLIHKAVIKADSAYVFDNSIIGKPPTLQLKFKNGIVVKTADNIYGWCQSLYKYEMNTFKNTLRPK